MIGCLLGALVGLACLAFVGDDFLLWIALIPPGIWLCFADPDRNDRRQLYRHPGDVRLSDEHGAGPGPAAIRSPPASSAWSGSWAGLSILFVVTLVLSLIPLSPPAPAPAAGD